MDINDATRYRDLIRTLQTNQERMAAAQEQASTGRRVNRPSDDPMAIIDIVRFSSEAAESDHFLRNIEFGRSKLQMTDSVLDGIENAVHRVVTLGLSSIGSTAPTEPVTTEISAIRDQILSSANTAYLGRYIFGGSVIDQPPYRKAGDGTITYNGNGNAMPLQVSRTATLDTQIPGSELFSGSIDIFSVTKDLTDAIAARNKDGVRSALSRIDSFTRVLSTGRTRLGAGMNAADAMETELKSLHIAREASRSNLQDADLAKALSELTQSETAYRAATAVGARIGQLSLLDYLR